MEFWFHTDGVFLPDPPRFVIIQLLRREPRIGGALHVLDTGPFLTQLPDGRLLYGTDAGGVEASIVESRGRDLLVRYRQDYMREVTGGPGAEPIHQKFRELAERHSVRVGSLRPDDCIVIDNWRVLHRRESFEGERLIRRVWLSPRTAPVS